MQLTVFLEDQGMDRESLGIYCLRGPVSVSPQEQKVEDNGRWMCNIRLEDKICNGMPWGKVKRMEVTIVWSSRENDSSWPSKRLGW